MGQKVNPHGMRVGIIRNWDSRWFARDEVFGDLLVEDNKIRKFIKKKIGSAGIPKIEIERDASDKVRIFIHWRQARRRYRQGRPGDREAQGQHRGAHKEARRSHHS